METGELRSKMRSNAQNQVVMARDSRKCVPKVKKWSKRAGIRRKCVVGLGNEFCGWGMAFGCRDWLETVGNCCCLTKTQPGGQEHTMTVKNKS